MAEELALDVEKLRHLETKIPEIETEEIQSKPESKGNFCDDIEQEEDASSSSGKPRTQGHGVQKNFIMNVQKTKSFNCPNLMSHGLRACCFIACGLCFISAKRVKRGSGIGTNDIKQRREFLSGILGSEETDVIENKPSEVTNCGDHKNVSEGQSMLHSFPLTEIKTPMGNTVLHIAAWNGKHDDVVDLVIERAPKLLLSFNKNDDSALHVAARAGHITTVKTLLAAYANYQRPEIANVWIELNEKNYPAEDYDDKTNMEDLLWIVTKKNIQGNTMLHEAMILTSGKEKIGDRILKAFERYNTKDREGNSLSESCYEYALENVNEAKQSVLYLAVEAGDKEAVKLILDKCPEDLKPEGLSPVVAAIMKRDQDMLSEILERKKNWIHLKDQHERLPLHYAASTGFHEGVADLLGICKRCSIQRDKYGYFPLHLASHGGQVEVVKKLLEYCLDPTEMLDNSGHVELVKKLLEYRPEPATEMLDNSQRNILHIAAKSGKHEVVRHILRTPKLHEMINQKDNNGDTPLHLATRSCHPKTVYYLTWDERVNLGLVNNENETPLDIVNALYQLHNSSTRQQLTWAALKSAGAKRSSSRVLPLESRSSDSKLNENSPKMERNNDKVSNQEQFKGRVETLTVVSTLIITASVAACLAVPGEADGTANNLYHAMFQFFIICVTLSFFSSVSATVILFWAHLGYIEFLYYSLKIVMPLLGVALISLTLAFLAGVYTVISKLHWLATTFVAMAVIFVMVVFLLYVLLSFPSTSTNKSLRCISYYPFLLMAWLAERKTNQGANF